MPNQKRMTVPFYEFLNCQPVDDLEEIRKKYTYGLSFIDQYVHTINEYELNYAFPENKGYLARMYLEKERHKYHLFIRLLHESYLAILLERKNKKTYDPIIKGLASFFESSDVKIFSPLKNNAQTEEYTRTKESYLNKLKEEQHGSTNAGIYLDTFSLGSIIELEEEVIKSSQLVKCLRLKEKLIYENLTLTQEKRRSER